MKQFYETYKESAKPSPLIKDINRLNNITILSSASHQKKGYFIKGL